MGQTVLDDSNWGFSLPPVWDSWRPLWDDAGAHPSLSLVSFISCRDWFWGNWLCLSLFSNLVVLQPWQASEPSGGLVEKRAAGPYPRVSDSVGLRWLVWGPHFGKHWLRYHWTDWTSSNHSWNSLRPRGLANVSAFLHNPCSTHEGEISLPVSTAPLLRSSETSKVRTV